MAGGRPARVALRHLTVGSRALRPEATGTYAIGLMLLACVAPAALVYAWFVLRPGPHGPAQESA
ncbi:MAG TPA: hypothetical protein VH912_33695 [Streptosporangiaceae bacterium]